MEESAPNPPLAVALDGGTTNTRARLVSGGRVVATARRAVGLRDAAREGDPGPIARAVRECLDELGRAAGPLPARVVAAGMLTADGGLGPVPHVPAPAGLAELARGSITLDLPAPVGRPVTFVPGVRTPPGPGPDGWAEADVMRGEEVETLGAWTLLGRPAGRHVFLWPGSHTKLVELDAEGRIARSFTTLAGELWSAVSAHTLVTSSLPAPPADPPDPAALEAGRRAAAVHGLGRAAFAVRLADLARALGPEGRAAFWLGAVIADDVAALLRHPILSRADPLVVGGRRPQRAIYARWLAESYPGPMLVLDDEQSEAASAVGAMEVAREVG